MISTTPTKIFGLSARRRVAALTLEDVRGATFTLGELVVGTGRRCLLGAIGRIG